MITQRSKKVHFHPEEDKLLRELVQKHGENWKSIAPSMPGRTERQCRERWCFFLKDDINRADFTPEEDSKLRKYVEANGTKWLRLTQEFSGRTPVQLKNRWSLINKRKSIPNNLPSPTPKVLFPIPAIHEKPVFSEQQESFFPESSYEFVSDIVDNFDIFGTDSFGDLDVFGTNCF